MLIVPGFAVATDKFATLRSRGRKRKHRFEID